MSATESWLRAAILGGLLLLLIGCGAGDVKTEVSLRTENSAAAATTLKEAAALSGRYFGAAIDNNYKNPDWLNNTSLTSTLKNHFSAITPENAGKWGLIHPRGTNYKKKGAEAEGDYDWGKFDEVLKFAHANNIKFRGHALVWKNLQNGNWVASLGKEDMKTAIRNHIYTIMKHYEKDNIYAWDVVNEAYLQNGELRKNQQICPSKTANCSYPDILSSDDQSCFGNTIGEEFIEVAFQAAYDAANEIEAAGYTRPLLCYNDYEIENINTKSTKVLELLRKLNADPKKRLVDCVGFQAHFRDDQTNHCVNGVCNAVPDTSDNIAANMQRFAMRWGDGAWVGPGVRIQITELDVRAGISKITQADAYQRIAEACGKVPECMGITTWGVRDPDSWIIQEDANAAPLLFNNNYQPKTTLFNPVMTALENYGSTFPDIEYTPPLSPSDTTSPYMWWFFSVAQAEDVYSLDRKEKEPSSNWLHTANAFTTLNTKKTAQPCTNFYPWNPDYWPEGYFCPGSGYEDSGLTSGKTYVYRLRGVDAQGRHYALPEWEVKIQ